MQHHKKYNNYIMSCGIERVIQLNNAISNISLRIIDSNNNDMTQYCKYAWSSDGVCWTSWTTYDNYFKITARLETDFYLKIKTKLHFVSSIFQKCMYKTCKFHNKSN